MKGKRSRWGPWSQRIDKFVLIGSLTIVLISPMIFSMVVDVVGVDVCAAVVSGVLASFIVLSVVSGEFRRRIWLLIPDSLRVHQKQKMRRAMIEDSMRKEREYVLPPFEDIVRKLWKEHEFGIDESISDEQHLQETLIEHFHLAREVGLIQKSSFEDFSRALDQQWEFLLPLKRNDLRYMLNFANWVESCIVTGHRVDPDDVMDDIQDDLSKYDAEIESDRSEGWFEVKDGKQMEAGIRMNGKSIRFTIRSSEDIIAEINRILRPCGMMYISYSPGTEHLYHYLVTDEPLDRMRRDERFSFLTFPPDGNE